MGGCYGAATAFPAALGIASVSYAAAPMRILILGGDGYLGWPTALRFSARGHDVSVLDDFSRRRWHEEAGTASLSPIGDLD
jgi:NAD(P)-dependent dehydrogenase (short-subunit alcohol dehydrogenase family)